jgi:hypothetical protein
VKHLRLVMFKDKSKRLECAEQPFIRLLKQGKVILHPAGLSDDSAIINVRHEIDLAANIAGTEAPHDQRQIER